LLFNESDENNDLKFIEENSQQIEKILDLNISEFENKIN
jgi:hypothetical protein